MLFWVNSDDDQTGEEQNFLIQKFLPLKATCQCTVKGGGVSGQFFVRVPRRRHPMYHGLLDFPQLGTGSRGVHSSLVDRGCSGSTGWRSNFSHIRTQCTQVKHLFFTTILNKQNFVASRPPSEIICVFVDLRAQREQFSDTPLKKFYGGQSQIKEKINYVFQTCLKTILAIFYPTKPPPPCPLPRGGAPVPASPLVSAPVYNL